MDKSLKYIVNYTRRKTKCQVCKGAMYKDCLRVGKRERSRYHDGSIIRWFHPNCFKRHKLYANERPKSTADFDNYDNIRLESQAEISKLIDAMNSDYNGNSRKRARGKENNAAASSQPPRKMSKTSGGDSVSTDGKAPRRFEDRMAPDQQMNTQTKLYSEMRDNLKKFTSKELQFLLYSNRQRVPKGKDKRLDAVADGMLFGALNPCQKCSGKFEYVSHVGYKCTGYVNAWVKCDEVTVNPVRKEFVVPERLQNASAFLRQYTPIVGKRIVRVTRPSISTWNTHSTTNNIQRRGKKVLRVTRSGVVDLDCGMAGSAHIYDDGTDVYSATLAKTCIQSSKNSHYSLQILEGDQDGCYYLFRSWGRIGTTQGDKSRKKYPLNICISKFQEHFLRFTGNQWSNRRRFVKKSGKMYPVDTDHGEEEMRKNCVESNLDIPVQNLMKLIFDIENMKTIMVRYYELDLDKMPLGSVSDNQILAAYKLLTTVLNEMRRSSVNRTTLINATNKFYTLIPHSCGTKNPPEFKSEKDIKFKCDMLSSLREITIAYKFSRLDLNPEVPRNILDVEYDKLKAEIVVLDKSTEMYKVIEKYVRASKREEYQLEIDEVFGVNRKLEDERYEPFKNYSNRKLLWHGSPTTNYAGILSHGLTIPSAERPAIDLMFGKGIYFADTVIKSSEYCRANSVTPIGLLLLCEVALGNMYECTDAENIEKLPGGNNSTMAHGRTRPDPVESYTTIDGVEVPCGPGIPNDRDHVTLNFNEYVVYKDDQVKIKYLVKVKFACHNFMEY